MADEPENLTHRMLREMRQEISERFDEVDTKINGVMHLMALMAGHSHDLEERVATLEDKRNSKADS